MNIYKKLDEAEDVLKQIERRCGSFSFRNSRSDNGSEEQQGNLLAKFKRAQLLLRLASVCMVFVFLSVVCTCTCMYFFPIVNNSLSCPKGRMKTWRQKLENLSHQKWKRTRVKMNALMLSLPC